MTDEPKPRWVLVWDDDDTLRPPALPVRSLEDELVPPATYTDLVAKSALERKKTIAQRAKDTAASKERNRQRRADQKAHMLAMRLRHI
jgi:hypothetical protein